MLHQSESRIDPIQLHQNTGNFLFAAQIVTLHNMQLLS